MAFGHDKKTEYSVGAKKFISLLFIVMITGGGTAHAEILGCEVGNTSDYVSPQGYWQMIDAPYQGECIIPGAPHPDSAFLHGNVNGAFRIEGRYRVDTVVRGGSWWSDTPKECPSNSCISGFREWMCNDVYGKSNFAPYHNYTPSSSYYVEDNMCVFHFDDGSTNIKYYTCFTDTAHIILREWKCNSQTPELIEPNKNQGPPACEQ